MFMKFTPCTPAPALSEGRVATPGQELHKHFVTLEQPVAVAEHLEAAGVQMRGMYRTCEASESDGLWIRGFYIDRPSSFSDTRTPWCVMGHVDMHRCFCETDVVRGGTGPKDQKDRRGSWRRYRIIRVQVLGFSV